MAQNNDNDSSRCASFLDGSNFMYEAPAKVILSQNIVHNIADRHSSGSPLNPTNSLHGTPQHLSHNQQKIFILANQALYGSPEALAQNQHHILSFSNQALYGTPEAVDKNQQLLLDTIADQSSLQFPHYHQ